MCYSGVVSRDGRSDHLHCPAPTESFTPARAVSRWPAWAVLEMRKKIRKGGSQTTNWAVLEVRKKYKKREFTDKKLLNAQPIQSVQPRNYYAKQRQIACR